MTECDEATRLKSALMRQEVRIGGNTIDLATVLPQRTVRSLTAYCITAAERRGRQLGVLIALLAVLLGSSSDARASLCELDATDEQLMSSVAEPERKSPEPFFQRAKVSAAAAGLECDPRDLNDCDINLPSGEPQAPSSTFKLRPVAAPGQVQAKLIAPPRARARYARASHGPRSGHYPSIDRPPRSQSET